MNQAPKIAIVMLAVGDLSGSGGAERIFCDLFAHLRNCGREVTLITSAVAFGRLSAAGRLASDRGVVRCPLGRRPAAGISGVLWATCCLLIATLGRGLDVVHIALPTPSYVPYLALLRLLPRAWRPRVTMTVVDCTLVDSLRAGRAADTYEQQVLDAHRAYVRWTRLDGIFAWYQSIVAANAALSIWPPETRVVAARYCFTNTERFHPAEDKPRLVVWAGRLSAQKRPLLFVDAIADLQARYPELARSWSFSMYGTGRLGEEVDALIRRRGVEEVVSRSHTIDLAPVFAKSRLFVSTQAIENFTSLAMLEAMAAGNAIVAADVGQTREFVRPGENGWLVSPASAEAFADAIAAYLADESVHPRMAAASRMLATEVHTVTHFTDDIMSFWSEIVSAP